MQEFRDLNAQVYGISVDSTWAHEAWRAKLELPADLVLLSDFNREFGAAYDLLTTRSGLKDILKRSVLVINPDGKIAFRWDMPEPPRLPTADEVLEGLRNAAAVQ